jgi:KUP system potassium uptake protein
VLPAAGRHDSSGTGGTVAPSGPPGLTSQVAPAPRGTRLARLSVAALGVVFGDIGTSPLYALRESFLESHGLSPVAGDVLGVRSLVFWSLVLAVSVKYLRVVLAADNQGEGGILALTALVGPSPRRPGERRHLVVILGLFGASLLYGDGMITPAISVLSAMEGLSVGTPGFRHWVVPATMAILAGLFLVQRHGTGRVGVVFGPLMGAWFLAIAVLGVAGIARAPGVLRAADPRHAIAFFGEHGLRGVTVLGAVFLVVTGAEALYADLGHFGRRPIRIAWSVLVFPSLVLNYFGQGALLLADPSAIENPFFHLVPRPFLYPMVALATVAAVIASQAVIAGSFSLTRQAVELGYFPRVEIRHTSAREAGQVYVPLVNTALFVASASLVVGFGASSRLAAAYGLAVTTTMLVTTLLIYVVMRRIWRWRRLTSLAVAGTFLVMDLAFLAGNAEKLFRGGWFPILVGVVGYVVLSTWRRGREILAERLRGHALSFEAFRERLEQIPHDRAPGVAVFLTADPETVPHTALDNLRHNRVVHERVLFLSIITDEVPRIPEGEGLTVEVLGSGFFRVVYRHGFMEAPAVPAILGMCASRGLEVDPSSVVYFVGRENLIPAPGRGMPLWRDKLFAFLARNAVGATRVFGIPPRQVIELGVQVEL